MVCQQNDEEVMTTLRTIFLLAALSLLLAPLATLRAGDEGLTFADAGDRAGTVLGAYSGERLNGWVVKKQRLHRPCISAATLDAGRDYRLADVHGNVVRNILS